MYIVYKKRYSFSLLFTMYIVNFMWYTMYIVKILQLKYIKFIQKKEGEREMTKKETAIFKNMYNEAMSEYMKYVMVHENAPVDVLERACVLSQLDTLFFPKDYMEQWA